MMQKNIQISVIAAVVVAIGAMMITSAFAPAAYAHSPRHHHHHSSVSIHISQKIHQENNGCSGECENNAVNIIGNGNSNIGNSP
ncbi:MAG: hypothetical protein M3044_23835 [Thermoproteota archaeon]|nr:hypothetical protein [Thermoproteota archaeon]